MIAVASGESCPRNVNPRSRKLTLMPNRFSDADAIAAFRTGPNGVQHWGYCPTCLRERKLIDGKLKTHRRWLPPNVVTTLGGGQKILTKWPYGIMVPCSGSGTIPMPEMAYV